MAKCRTERLLRSFVPSTILTLSSRVCIDHIVACMTIFFFYWSSRIFDNVIAKWSFWVRQFFGPKSVSQSSRIITIAFFFFPPFLLLALSPFLFFRYYDFGASQSGLRNLPFDTFSLKWLQISLGCFSKNRLGIYIKNRFGILGNSITYHRHYCKPVPFFIRFACNLIFKNACNNVVLIH